jgi:large subunit ribosomal protein L19
MAKTLTTESKTKLPEIHPGDIIRVHQKITEGTKERIQVFEGIVIKTKGKTNPGATFTVRKITYGVGVERTFPLYSPSVVKIEFKKGSDVRRAKLYYLRNLSGKALKMKEKKIDKDLWELVAQTQTEEPSEEMLEEAVQAAKETEEPISESPDTKTETNEEIANPDKSVETVSKPISQAKDDTVEEEAKTTGGEEKDDKTQS